MTLRSIETNHHVFANVAFLLLQKFQQINNEIRGDRNLAHKAHWEAKTNKLIEKNIVRNRVADMRRREAANLEQRKARLAELLAAEDRIYE